MISKNVIMSFSTNGNFHVHTDARIVELVTLPKSISVVLKILGSGVVLLRELSFIFFVLVIVQ